MKPPYMLFATVMASWHEELYLTPQPRVQDHQSIHDVTRHPHRSTYRMHATSASHTKLRGGPHQGGEDSRMAGPHSRVRL
eukprot:COSAG01_NODE_51963_length_350_cov_1.019920_1_plen_79_part_10